MQAHIGSCRRDLEAVHSTWMSHRESHGASITLSPTADRAAGLGAQRTSWSSECKSWKAAEAARQAHLRGAERKGEELIGGVSSLCSVHCAGHCTHRGSLPLSPSCPPCQLSFYYTSQDPPSPSSQGPHIICWQVPPAFPAKLSVEPSWSLSSSFPLPMPLPKVLLVTSNLIKDLMDGDVLLSFLSQTSMYHGLPECPRPLLLIEFLVQWTSGCSNQSQLPWFKTLKHWPWVCFAIETEVSLKLVSQPSALSPLGLLPTDSYLLSDDFGLVSLLSPCVCKNKTNTIRKIHRSLFVFQSLPPSYKHERTKESTQHQKEIS